MRAQRKRPASLRARAYHEAGHAVAALCHGFRVLHARVLGPETSDTDYDTIPADVLVKYAGLAGQRLIDPSAPDADGGDDAAQAARLVRDMLRSKGRRKEYRDQRRADAAHLVRKLRAPIAALARVLMRRPKMSGAEVEKVVAPYLRRLRIGRLSEANLSDERVVRRAHRRAPPER